MKTKTLIAIILLTALLTSTATATVFHFSLQDRDSANLFVDDETGIEYWLVSQYGQAAMSVRYKDANGTLKMAEGY